MPDHVTPPTMCPSCGYVTDRAGTMEGDGPAPTEGDLSVCIRCASLAIYTPELRLRVAVGLDLADMEPAQVLEIARVRTAILALPSNTRRQQGGSA